MTINNTQRQFCSDGQLGGGGGSLAAAAWWQRGLSGRLLLVDCCLFLPPPSPLPQVSSSPPYLSLNSKMKKNIVKIVSYQYIPNWNYLLFN
jgi:hypothetical protein